MDPEELIEIVSSGERELCAELALVLESQSIPSQIRWNGHAWVLSVAAEAVAPARLEIAAYRAERATVRPAPVLATASGDCWTGVAVYAAVILGMALVAPEMRFGFDWLSAGGMDSAALKSGEWWRPITALSLHADAAHVLGNAAFGAFFGYTVARYIGSGFGWLAIVAGGALGNLANAFLSGPDHRSIGASTAVFAALGLLSAYCWRRGFPPNASRRERLAPIFAGIGLLAFTGTGGENTDIGAHLLGFVAGFVNGLLIARFGFPRSDAVQRASAAVLVGLFIVAWIAALT